MRKSKTTLALVATLLAALLVWPITGAFAARTTIYVNRGIGTARLGMNDSTAAKRIGPVKKKIRDSDYPGQVYWVWYFGRKTGGRYAIEMHSNSKRKVWSFVVYSSSYKTLKGIHVGSTESALRKAYGKSLKKSTGPIYTKYYLGGRPRTEFYVKSSRVKQISVWTY